MNSKANEGWGFRKHDHYASGLLNSLKIYFKSPQSLKTEIADSLAPFAKTTLLSPGAKHFGWHFKAGLIR